MDEIAKYNIERWRALAEADALFTRPALDMDAAAARERIDPEGVLGEVAGRRVLCLASGGGQQSAAFALLGARVTVFDLSVEQLERDRLAAAHYGLEIETLQGDMRDLSRFDESLFDIVYHAHSLNFVPDARAVFREVARVVRRGGLYFFNCANPFFLGLAPTDWNGEGYTLRQHYVDGGELITEDSDWVYDRSRHEGARVPGGREFRHTLSTLTNGLIEQGFRILRLSDTLNLNPDPSAAPGTWEHFMSVAPPWLAFWSSYDPADDARGDSQS